MKYELKLKKGWFRFWINAYSLFFFSLITLGALFPLFIYYVVSFFINNTEVIEIIDQSKKK